MQKFAKFGKGLNFASLITETGTTMKIKVNTVEGKTSKKGTKQGRTYTITSASKTNGFFYATADNGNEVNIWNVRGDWSRIGITRNGFSRTSYTSDFEIIQP